MSRGIFFLSRINWLKINFLFRQIWNKGHSSLYRSIVRELWNSTKKMWSVIYSKCRISYRSSKKYSFDKSPLKWVGNLSSKAYQILSQKCSLFRSVTAHCFQLSCQTVSISDFRSIFFSDTSNEPNEMILKLCRWSLQRWLNWIRMIGSAEEKTRFRCILAMQTRISFEVRTQRNSVIFHSKLQIGHAVFVYDDWTIFSRHQNNTFDEEFRMLQKNSWRKMFSVAFQRCERQYTIRINCFGVLHRFVDPNLHSKTQGRKTLLREREREKERDIEGGGGGERRYIRIWKSTYSIAGYQY